MGSSTSKVGVFYPFVGRRGEKEDVIDKVRSNRIVTIVGISKSGKSRFVREIVETISIPSNDSNKYLMLELDNKYEDEEDLNHDLLGKIGTLLRENVETFKPLKVIQCFKDKGTRFLVIDSVDALMKSEKKDKLLEFVTKSVDRCQDLTIILTASEKPKFIINSYVEIELKPLRAEDILEIITFVRKRPSDERSEVKIMDGIARLCDGSPHAATMAGSLLKEDFGFITPANLLEVMIYMRGEVLSPDNYPETDRLRTLTDDVRQETIGKELSNTLHTLAKTLPENYFTDMEAFERRVDTEDTPAHFKIRILRKLLGKSLVSTADGKRLYLHGILRECIILYYIDTDTSVRKADSLLRKILVRENVKLAGIDLSEDKLLDKTAIEQVVSALEMNTESTTGSERGADEDRANTQDLPEALPDSSRASVKNEVRYSTEDQGEELQLDFAPFQTMNPAEISSDYCRDQLSPITTRTCGSNETEAIQETGYRDPQSQEAQASSNWISNCNICVGDALAVPDYSPGSFGPPALPYVNVDLSNTDQSAPDYKPDADTEEDIVRNRGERTYEADQGFHSGNESPPIGRNLNDSD